MALEAIFRQLVEQIQGLHETLHYLNLTVGDQPQDDGAMLADDLDEVVLISFPTRAAFQSVPLPLRQPPSGAQ